MSRERLETVFPGLKRTGYSITSPMNRAYNCLAWAVGEHQRKWSPEYPYFWPEHAEDNSVASIIHAFTHLGFEECPNGEWESSYEKVAFYTLYDEFTHIARQLPTGEWTSKCGDGEDITHTLAGLEGEKYGAVTCFLKRQREQTD